MAFLGWLLAISILLYYFWKRGRPKEFPPGPWPLPFFGNMFQFSFLDPLKDLRKLAKQYGPLVGVHIGGTSMVIIQDLALAKEVLLTKGIEFAGRPDSPANDLINKRKGISSLFADIANEEGLLELWSKTPAVPEVRHHCSRMNKCNVLHWGGGEPKMEDAGLRNITTGERSSICCILMAPYGQAWKEQRRFSLMSLRNFGMGKKSMEERILAEASCLIQAFSENTSAPFNPYGLLDRAVTNIISAVVFGKRFEYDDDTLQNVLDLVHQNLKSTVGLWALLYNEVPLLRRLLLSHQTILTNVQKIFAFLTKELGEHKTTFVPGEHRDLIDAYLHELQKSEQKGSSFDDENLFIVVSDLLLAGTETTGKTLQWALLHMMVYPEIQEKCQQEIDAVLGNNPCLKYEDRERLPYTNAVIHEILRFSSVAPLGLAHAPTRDIRLSGYVIPRGTGIIISIHSVHRDESHWKSPNKFDPSNFLNEKGEFVKSEAFLAFSAGPRVCLGENLARMELFLFFTSILRNFQVSCPDGSGEPDCTPHFAGTIAPAPFQVSLKQRQQK